MGPTCHSLSLFFTFHQSPPSPPHRCPRPLSTGAGLATPPLLCGSLEVAAMEVSLPILSSSSPCSPARRREPAAPPTPLRRPYGGGHRGVSAVFLPAAGAETRPRPCSTRLTGGSSGSRPGRRRTESETRTGSSDGVLDPGPFDGGVGGSKNLDGVPEHKILE
jgi:hypothetical protein